MPRHRAASPIAESGCRTVTVRGNRRDIERRRQFVPASDWAVLVALLQTETLDVMPGDRKRLAAVCHRVRRALDYLALYDNQISRAEFLTLYPGASVRGGTR